MQLVQYIDDIDPRTFIRVARSDFEDRQVFHVTMEQGHAIYKALAEILTRNDKDQEVIHTGSAQCRVDGGSLTRRPPQIRT
ncbi:hypothetical protein D0Q02_20405 [Micromonospora craniellae]|uniref:Uncharacterized protein n=1 Tax=Micromonospora craniellae TaxID=2294034 RepID=A0A372FW35_9ACTN|nr:hypothetical protein D0Q02_20405 [Micromonospora craniellae]